MKKLLKSMENFKVFTWNEKNYGKPGELFDRIKGLGVKPVCIIDPGTKVEKGYSIDDEGIAKDYFAKDKAINLFTIRHAFFILPFALPG